MPQRSSLIKTTQLAELEFELCHLDVAHILTLCALLPEQHKLIIAPC